MPTYTLSGVELEFPYEAYPCQLDYMTKVVQALQQGQHALLESPTGTGKTLCLLCATLAWRKSLSAQAAAAVGEVQQQPHSSALVQGLREAWAEHRASKLAEGGPSSGLPQIVYSSRTHSQLQQVMRELKACSYKPRAATVASRQHGCLHPVVSTMVAGANQACRALVSKRACKWYNGVEKFVRRNPEANTEVLDIEDLGRIGESRTACPYYLAREMAATAEIIFLPYNYLLDAKTRGGLGIAWQNAVLIFDEAHNVEQVCSDSMSFDLPAGALAGAIEELGTAAEVAVNKGDTPVNVFNELGGQDRNISLANVAGELQRARAVLCRLEQEIAALAPHPDTGLTRPGSFLFELLGRCGINSSTWRVLQQCLDAATSVLIDEAVEAGRRTGSRSSTYALNQVAEALRLAFVGTAGEPELPPLPLASSGGQRPPPQAVLQQPATPQVPASHVSYRVHVHMEKSKNGRLTPTLSYWCFSPGLSMQQLTDMQVRSILLTSGTLSPLDSFAHELALPFPVRLENPHVIAREQVWVGVVPSGPGGKPLNSSYQNREDAEYRNDLGLTLINLCRIVPDGLLVFFPSYALLQSCIATWKHAPISGGPSIWERIAKSKQPVIEPRESMAFNAAAEDFRAKLLNPAYNSAVFFAVTRGKASEGLDFSDSAGRAVVLTGIPYAMKTDPKVRLKQEVLNEARSGPRKRAAADGEGGGAPPHAGLSGDQWYSQNAMRAVNQAVGRVIRHRRDYGAIILCDERFRSPNVLRQLSCWLRGMVTVHGSYGAANASLVQFFKQQGAAAGQGLVDGGGLAVVPGTTRPGPFGAAAAPGRCGGVAAPFQGVGNADDGSGRRSLLQLVPTAIDAVGMTELFAPVAAAAAAAAVADAEDLQQQYEQQQRLRQPCSLLLAAGIGSSQGGGAAGGCAAARLMAVLGGSGGNAPTRQVSGKVAVAAAAVDNLLSELGAAEPAPLQQGAAVPAAGLQQAGSEPGGGGRAGSVASGSKIFEPRPWERTVLAVSARLCPPSAPATAAGAGGGRGGAAGNVVGPAHLVAKHAKWQRARSASVEPEHVQQPAAAAAAAATERGEELPAGPALAGQQLQVHEQQGVATAAEKKAKRTATVNAFMVQLRATLLKEHFDLMRRELQSYSQGKDVPRLLAAALPLLLPHPALLEGFEGFLPKALLPTVKQQVQQLQAAAAAASAGPGKASLAGGVPLPAAQRHQLAPGLVSAGVAAVARQQQPPWRGPGRHQMLQGRGMLHQHQQQGNGWQGPGLAAGLPPAPPGVGGRQPLAQQQRHQYQQQQQGQMGQKRAAPAQTKLQQLVAGGLPRQAPGVEAARPGSGIQQQQQRGPGGGGASRVVLMPPRGMQQVLQGTATVPRGGAGGAGMQLPQPGLGSRPGSQGNGPPCPVCSKAPMEAPHEAGCGHTACYACWLKALAQFKCPVCSRGVRKNQLTKRYFA